MVCHEKRHSYKEAETCTLAQAPCTYRDALCSFASGSSPAQYPAGKEHEDGHDGQGVQADRTSVANKAAWVHGKHIPLLP